MPRQRIPHDTISRDFPADFPQRLKRFKEESRLPWAEIARRLGVYPTPCGAGRGEQHGPTGST